MNVATHRRWYAEDLAAEQHLAAFDGDAEAVRLDVPGWGDRQRAGAAVTGLVVGTGRRTLDLAAAVADLSGRDEIMLLLPDVDRADWLAACAAWRLVDPPTHHGESLVVRAAPTGPGPTLSTLHALHHRRASPTATRHAAPWRLRLEDPTARAWFGELVTSCSRVALAVASNTTTRQRSGRDDDAPVADDPTDPRTRRLTIADGSGSLPAAPGTVAVSDDPLDAGDGVHVVARPVDLRRFSPVGCSPRAASAAPILPISPHGHPDGVADARQAATRMARTLAEAGAVGGAAVDELALGGDGTPHGGQLAGLRRAVALLDHPAVHADAAGHARWLLGCVAAGVPVVLLADLPGPVAGLLGDEVVAALATTTVDDLGEPDGRERASVLQRRAVLARHTVTARLRELAPALGLLAPPPRSVSIVMATNRSDFIEHACRQIARQVYAPLEVVVVTHGPQAPASARRAVAEHLGHLPTELRHVTDAWTLGDALNVGVETARGEVITKFDDDDWYSPHHVTELLQALAYSGADVVGKAAEFVHVADADTTLRRWGQGGERYSPTLAGGTLTFRRDVWREVAGFPRVGLGEDRGLIDDVRDAGGTTYRCHPFGYLLHRHGRHAWTVDDQAFLDSAVATRPGLDLDWTLT